MEYIFAALCGYVYIDFLKSMIEIKHNLLFYVMFYIMSFDHLNQYVPAEMSYLSYIAYM